MKSLLIRLIAAFSLVFLVAACGDQSKEDILKKTESVSTRAELERALGRPDDIQKLGPIETWTYNASNGSVSFILAGDTVTVKATGERRDPPR